MILQHTEGGAGVFHVGQVQYVFPQRETAHRGKMLQGKDLRDLIQKDHARSDKKEYKHSYLSCAIIPRRNRRRSDG